MAYSVFTQAVIDTVKQIPPGKVLTYGEVAKYAGSPRSARQVARILHSLSKKENLPWHRVVGKGGQVTLLGEGQSLQKQLLLNEGLEFLENSSQIKDFF